MVDVEALVERLTLLSKVRGFGWLKKALNQLLRMREILREAIPKRTQTHARG